MSKGNIDSFSTFLETVEPDAARRAPLTKMGPPTDEAAEQKVIEILKAHGGPVAVLDLAKEADVGVIKLGAILGALAADGTVSVTEDDGVESVALAKADE